MIIRRFSWKHKPWILPPPATLPLHIERNTFSRKITPTFSDSNSAISLQLYFLIGDAVLLSTQCKASSKIDICRMDWRSTYSKHLDSSTCGLLAIAAKASMNSMLMQLNVTRKIHASHIFSYTYAYIWHTVKCSHRNFKMKSSLWPCLLTIIALLPGSKGKLSSAGLPATSPHCHSERTSYNK